MPKTMPIPAGFVCLLFLLSPAGASNGSPFARPAELEFDSAASGRGAVVGQRLDIAGLEDDEDPDDDAEDEDDDDDDDDDDEPIPRPVTCESAKKIVKRAGFKDVGVRSCIGKTFRLTGSRNGYNLEIIVSRSGRILGTRRR